MEKEKSIKNIRISSKLLIIVFEILLLLIGFYLYNAHDHNYTGDYQMINYYSSEDLPPSLVDSDNDYLLLNNYSEYSNLLKKAKQCGWKDIKYTYDSNFFENNSLIFTEIIYKGIAHLNTELISVNEHSTSVNMEIYINATGDTTGIIGKAYFIPVPKKTTTAKIKYLSDYTYQYEKLIGTIIVLISLITLLSTFLKKSEDESIKGTMLRLLKIIIASIIIIFVCMTALNVYNNANTTIDKPIIYLYPQEDTDITVNLQYSNNITVSYPKYNPNIGWHVLAKPDGNLIDLSTKKNLYSLYYESKSVIKPKIEKDGFVIKGSDASSFLEEKLAVLGLNERESEEFIIYWLPKLEHNKYNYIRFATIDEINNNMSISINPNPNTLIRVLMTYKGLNKPINVEEQKLDTPERNGFVVVEWGGTMIN